MKLIPNLNETNWEGGIFLYTTARQPGLHCIAHVIGIHQSNPPFQPEVMQAKTNLTLGRIGEPTNMSATNIQALIYNVTTRHVHVPNLSPCAAAVSRACRSFQTTADLEDLEVLRLLPVSTPKTKNEHKQFQIFIRKLAVPLGSYP